MPKGMWADVFGDASQLGVSGYHPLDASGR